MGIIQQHVAMGTDTKITQMNLPWRPDGVNKGKCYTTLREVLFFIWVVLVGSVEKLHSEGFAAPQSQCSSTT